MKPVRGLARALLGSLFIATGGQALLKPQRYAQDAAPLAQRMAPRLERLDPRLPTEPATLVRVNGAVQLGAGLLLATGKAPRPAAALLAGTLIPATVINHPFWTAKGAERTREATQFAKNMGLLGGLLLAAVDTAGAPSLNWRTRHAVRKAKRNLPDKSTKLHVGAGSGEHS